MATIAAPRKRLRLGRKSLIIGGILLVVVICGGLSVLGNAMAKTAQVPTPGWVTIDAKTGAIDATIGAIGNVEPLAQADLRFAVDGMVSAILVKPGDKIQAGQPIARIDDADLKLGVDKAMGDLQQAQADYQELETGASPQEIAEAKARIAQAQGQYQQAAGSVTTADIAAARAKLDQAQAHLARLQSGAAPEDRASAEAKVQQAQSALEQARSQLASEKEHARLGVETAANTLRNKQDTYSRVYWDNRKLENDFSRAGIQLPQENKDQEAAAKRDVDDAAAALDEARIAYEDAKKQEIATLQTREADLRSAQTDLEKVQAGPRRDELAEARAGVQSAQAELNRLIGANHAGDLAAARAGVEQAQAQLDKLTADPSTSALTRAQAAVARAEAAVKQAQRLVDQATLKAPFAATVARIDMRVGESAGPNAIVAIADLSSFHIDVPVDELDVAQVQNGQKVHIALDALPDHEIAGTVTNVEPLATKNDKGTNTYKVVVAIDASDAAVRPGMTATIQIVTHRKENVVLVPRRAVQTENGQSYVLIPTSGLPNAQTKTPASERRNVTVGLSNSESVEIAGGLKAGEKVLMQDVVSTWNPLQSTK